MEGSGIFSPSRTLVSLAIHDALRDKTGGWLECWLTGREMEHVDLFFSLQLENAKRYSFPSRSGLISVHLFHLSASWIWLMHLQFFLHLSNLVIRCFQLYLFFPSFFSDFRILVSCSSWILNLYRLASALLSHVDRHSLHCYHYCCLFSL